MKPAPFTYHDPRSVADAVGLLATLENARPLAGGQSLMPAMNFRYAMPDHLIDLNRIEELAYVRPGDGTLEIGAMTRQRDIEFSDTIAQRCPVLQAALAHVGHRQTRNRGTLGGSLCHLDPSAELLNMAALLDARLTAASTRGARTLGVGEFAEGYMTTALAPDELLTSVTLALPPRGARFGFVEFARRHGDFSIVAVSSLLVLDARGTIARAALAISGLAHAPVRPTAIEAALAGQRPDEQTFKAAAAAAHELEARGDTYASPEYRRHLARILTFRALEQAAQHAGN